MFPPVQDGRGRALFAALAFAIVLFLLWLAVPRMAGDRLRSMAQERGLRASWRSLSVAFPLHISARDLALVDALGDTTTRIQSMDLDIDLWSLVTLSPRPSRVLLTGARFTRRAPAGPEDEPPPPRRAAPHRRPDRLPRVRASARGLARLLMIDPPSLRVSLRDLTVVTPGDEDEPARTALHVDSLDLKPQGGVIRLIASGVVGLEDETPFGADLSYARSGRLTGGVEFELGARGRERLPVWLDARFVRGGTPRALRLEPGSTITVGPVELEASGFVEPESPRFRFSLGTTDVKPELLVQRLPASLLGPLADLRVTGSFDYALVFDLDLERPDSVSFEADVTPHGLALAPSTTLELTNLDQPFTARIHLPHGRIVEREMSSANPHFRTLDAIDSTLAHAVVANEDGGFFRHRGFNTEAVRQAIAENLRAGAYRRGAGTITMQLARNLYLGHERTLARKGQEVVLAWVLEHLTGVPKQRLLELYLNIIEWGPDVHGADEACQYYFGHDAGRVTVDEALFLATVVPAPTKWKYRFEPEGGLRAFERAQMHFIGRAMVAKGWLPATALPAAESLSVTLGGPARGVLFPIGPKFRPEAELTGGQHNDVQAASD